MKYSRILLKLSGEALMGDKNYGFDPERITAYVNDIKDVVSEGVQLAIVIGGGNIYRGIKGTDEGMDRVQGDYMGMMATIINAVALQSFFDKAGVPSKILSGIAVDPVCELMSRKKAHEYLSANHVVIIGGGTGNPFFTTDTAAALRALEINAEVILKGTRVDGVYNADPEKNTAAVRFDSLSFNEAYEKNLNIMDLTAFTLCRDNNLPVIVFNMNVPGNLKKVLNGEKIGTLVKNGK